MVGHQDVADFATAQFCLFAYRRFDLFLAGDLLLYEDFAQALAELVTVYRFAWHKELLDRVIAGTHRWEQEEPQVVQNMANGVAFELGAIAQANAELDARAPIESKGIGSPCLDWRHLHRPDELQRGQLVQANCHGVLGRWHHQMHDPLRGQQANHLTDAAAAIGSDHFNRHWLLEGLRRRVGGERRRRPYEGFPCGSAVDLTAWGAGKRTGLGPGRRLVGIPFQRGQAFAHRWELTFAFGPRRAGDTRPPLAFRGLV